ncbi:hypothetical protein TNCV_1969011 [Trichonephila clavipes]|nr:hypothetical protein TNCV_1969011 [Trichonephila clavipes]
MNLRICAGIYSTLFLIVEPPWRERYVKKELETAISRTPWQPTRAPNPSPGLEKFAIDSSTARRVRKQWTDEHRATRKTGSGRRKVTSARDDRHLLRMGVNSRTASFSRWSTATGVLMSASSIR